MSEAQQHASIEDAYLYGVTLRVVSAPDQVSQASSALAPLGEVTHAEPSLEDAFVALVRQRQESPESQGSPKSQQNQESKR